MTVALATYITHGPPIFFRQLRPGHKQKPFVILKFRTMRPLKTKERLSDHLRTTGLGTFLRKYSLDELPQLWNVVKGEMSLVGPRPLLMEYLPRYNQRQRKRHNMPPGITGQAQINGRNALSWEEKFELDVWYVENWSFMMDIKILLTTIKKVLKGKGVNTSEKITMPIFKGSAKHE